MLVHIYYFCLDVPSLLMQRVIRSMHVIYFFSEILMKLAVIHGDQLHWRTSIEPCLGDVSSTKKRRLIFSLSCR
ncbi:hypothetical protein QJS04_geneDACA004385 [Acorus gramineus]|uniref:Uncharacterized protein n=1 Tax=Acorus gramineus TaxID=55184 RepID=A0AAV9B2L6_ACOGR|nr:hypothetical protein QJS04_geneDACA004385 [Acorus gramineus]